jgi:hypothetical protein
MLEDGALAMSPDGTGAQSKHQAIKDLSSRAQAAHHWFRQLGRALKVCRLYKPDNPTVIQVREQLLDPVLRMIESGGPLRFRITASEIFLLDEAVVFPTKAREDEISAGGQEQALPFLFYRDGIRGITFLPGLPRRDMDALFDAMLTANDGIVTHDDLVTLMWQANCTHVQIDSVPLEQAIFLSSNRPTGGGGSGEKTGQSYAWSPSGKEIRADLGQESGVAQGLHKDTFDDWELPEEETDVVEAYERLLPAMEFSRMRLSTEWVGERSTDWTIQAPDLLRQIRALSSNPGSSAVLAHSIVSWLVSAIQRTAWAEAQSTMKLLREFDPDGSSTDAELIAGIAALDTDDITERLDESETDDQALFFALTIGLGRHALDLSFAVMAKAKKSRTRAAAMTALCYTCADEPSLIGPYIEDVRWYVARNAVLVLGQIGGAEVVPLLHLAARYPEPRVRRQVVASLGNVPREMRAEILLGQLDTEDPQLLAGALNMLARERDPETAQTILRQISAPEFENRREETQRAYFNALAEIADDATVPALETVLNKGGWFARRSFVKVAAARTLRRIGSTKAIAVLNAGLASRNQAVRAACEEAVAVRKAG